MEMGLLVSVVTSRPGTERDPLLDRIEQVRQRAERLARLYRWATVAIAALVIWAAVSLMDYHLRPEGAGWRWFASGLWWTVVAVTAVQLHRRSQHTTLTRAAVARRLEHRFPQLRDWLTTAVDFLSEWTEHPAGDSPALRQQVIETARGKSEGLDFSSVLSPDDTYRRARMAAALTAAAILVAIIAPQVFVRSWQRLLLPFRHVPWPQVHQLQLVELPEYVVAGTPLEVRVRDRSGHLPEDVALEFYREGSTPGARDIERVAMRPDGQRSAVAELPPVNGPIRLRAVGGDDQSMPWYPVSVAPAQRIEEARLLVTWPSYTGWDQTEATLNHVRVLPETQLAWEGRVDRPLHSANWCFQADSADQDAVHRTELRVAGRRFETKQHDAPSIRHSGAMWLELVDARRGLLTRTPAWRVTVLPDQPPVVMWAAQQDSHSAAPRSGTIPLEFEVDEDVGIQEVRLRFRGDADLDEPWRDRVLDEVVPVTPTRDGTSFLTGSEEASRVRVGFRWQLDADVDHQLEELSYVVELTDLLGQKGESPMRKLRLVDSFELSRQWQQELADLVDQLGRVMVLQQDAHHQVQHILEQRTDQEDQPAALTKVHEAQQEIRRQFSADPGGLFSRLQSLHDSVTRSEADNAVLSTDVASAAAELQRAAGERMPRIDQLLRTRETGLQGEQGEARLREVAGAQQDVLRAVRRALDRLSLRTQYQSLVHELAEIQRQQNDLHQQLRHLQREWIVQLAQGDTDQADARRAQLETQQQQLAWKAEQWGARLEGLSQDSSLATSDRQRLDTARQAWQHSPPALAMREAASQLIAGRMGPAAQRQQEAIQGLGALDRQLRSGSAGVGDVHTSSHGPREKADVTPDRLKRALDELIAQQSELQQQTLEARPAEGPPLAANQRELRDRAAELRTPLHDMPAIDLGLQETGRLMRSAADQLQQQAMQPAAEAQHAAGQIMITMSRALDRKHPDDGSNDTAAADSPAADDPGGAVGEPSQSEPGWQQHAQLVVVLHLQRQLAAAVRRLAQEPISPQERVEQARQLAEVQARIRSVVEQLAESGSSALQQPDHSRQSAAGTSQIDQQLDRQLFPSGSLEPPLQEKPR